MTRHIVAIFALAAFAAGCRPKVEPVDEFRAGVPREETVKVETPMMTAGKALVVESQSQALKGFNAEYWRLTVGVGAVINGGALFVGALVRSVLHFPPTSLSADTAIWGPFPNADEKIIWKITIKKVGDNKFQYQFEGQSMLDPASPFQTVLAGTHNAAVDDQGDPIEGYGAGSFTLDWNARQKLPMPKTDEVGSVTYNYSRLPGATANVDASFKQVLDKDTKKLIDVDYLYTHHLGGSGTLEFSYDVAAQMGMPDGHATVKSRWQPNGAGRADATLTSSTLMTPGTLSECWNGQANSTFMKRSWAPIFDYGTEATDCVYTSAEYSKL